ncbi:hypothetical protein PAXRUDRAFT_14520 [Paxillus rubicundulus Ve08.2h10]|uniref:Uncharacterized protein n=1 Tax=Paxillus rubicundulus Ve08.2h10 TaxID=930991 RepID=A0A0D0DV85_9AGAM|nr:hypothetical protein PAXRUDRAFT_14520 [Paxillus rubicundulus Ve08.2h10]
MDIIINNNHNVSTLGDVIIMDVDELHPAWKTYFINVTPSEPGPLKLVLRLKAKQTTLKSGIEITSPQAVNDSETTSDNVERSSDPDTTIVGPEEAINPELSGDPDTTIVEPKQAINPRKASLQPRRSTTTSCTRGGVQTHTRRPRQRAVAKPVRVLHLPTKPKDSTGMEIESNNKLDNIMIDPNEFPPRHPLAAFRIAPAQAAYDTAVAQYDKN